MSTSWGLQAAPLPSPELAGRSLVFNLCLDSGFLALADPRAGMGVQSLKSQHSPFLSRSSAPQRRTTLADTKPSKPSRPLLRTPPGLGGCLMLPQLQELLPGQHQLPVRLPGFSMHNICAHQASPEAPPGPLSGATQD